MHCRFVSADSPPVRRHALRHHSSRDRSALNPSHVPGLHETADRTTGRAVYDSVSTFFPHGPDVAGDAALTPSLLSSLGDRGIPSKQRRRRRLSSDYGRGSLYGAAEKVPVPPIPDLRYEQGVLASLQPFLHRVPASPNSSTNHTSTPQETEKHARKVDSAEKATLAARDLTAEGGPDTADRPSDIFLGPLRIEWSRVAYVIVRDQVRRPISSSS